MSFNTRQLNRAAPGSATNQLADLTALGYLDTPALPDVSSVPALVDPSDPATPLEARARAYLDANCAQCHQPGGTALGGFDARAGALLSLSGIVNGSILGVTNIPADRVIVPGDAAHSVLLRRMRGNGTTRMPPLGSNERDLAGESLVAQWMSVLAEPKPASRLLNLAARAQVGSGGDVLIPGFVIAGGPRAVLVRAIGPTLGDFGVGGALAAPVLTLFDAEGRLEFGIECE